MSLRIRLIVLLIVFRSAAHVQAQDTRNVSEPVFPKTCAVFHAPLRSTADGPGVGPTAEEQDAESVAESARLVQDLGQCAPGEAVELALASDSSYDAFLINPIAVPEHISLIIDGGVTVFGSRDPLNYQDPATPSVLCGTIGHYAIGEGCLALITLAADSGVYGYGVLDGQGDRLLLGGENANTATWWDLTRNSKTDAGDCPQPSDATGTPPSGCQQANPLMISAGNMQGRASLNENLTLYKITIRNPPFHTVKLGGDGVTVWGVKVQAPWNIPNTDGFDIHASNVTVRDSTVANGDQDIAFVSSNKPSTNITVDHFAGYSKGGINILADGDETSQLLVENVNITGDLPSVVSTIVNGKPEMVVNGMSESAMKAQYGLQSYGQALPNATDDLKALQITNQANPDQSQPAAKITDVTFKSVCIHDIVIPINIAFSPSNTFPTVQGITFQDVHIFSPTSQFPNLKKGIPQGSAPGTYKVFFDADPQAAGQPEFINQFTLDNVVFNDLSAEKSSISLISASGNQITTATNVYPSTFNDLDAAYSNPPETKEVRGTELGLSANSYVSKTPTIVAGLAYACPSDPMPFTIGDLFISKGRAPATGSSNNLRAVSIRAGSSITLNAIVQPVMSHTTTFVKDSYGADPGLLAVGSPALSNPVGFYEGSKRIGVEHLSANGTLASLVVKNIPPGKHTYTAQYPADRYYAKHNFGSVTVEARRRCLKGCDHTGN
jgi:hypothetical protein